MADEFPSPSEGDLTPRFPIPPTEREVQANFRLFVAGSKPAATQENIDLAKLFRAYDYVSHDGRQVQVRRRYYGLGANPGEFDLLTEVLFNKDIKDGMDPEDAEFYLKYVSKAGERDRATPEVTVSFPDGRFSKSTELSMFVGETRIHLYYGPKGHLFKVDDGTYGWGPRGDNKDAWEYYFFPEEGSELDQVVNSDEDILHLVYKNGTNNLVIRRFNGGTLVIPDYVDIEGLKDLLAPKKLLRSPIKARTDLDSTWKNVDLLKLFGIREVLLEDVGKGEDYPTS